MKKIFLVLALAMFGASCVQNFNEVSVAADSSVQGGLTQEQRAKKIVIDMLHRVDPQTRGYVRQIASVDFMSYEQLMGSRTRTESDSTDTDGLKFNPNPIRNDGFHLINFADSTGYAIVGQIRDDLEMFDPDADDDSGAVGLLAMTDSGSITTEEILSYGDEWMNGGGNSSNNTSSNNTYAYDEQVGDYLIGETDPDKFISSLLYAYAYNVTNGNETESGDDFTDYEEVESVANDQKGPLLNTKWWQSLPFNYYIHTYNSAGDKRPVGCVTVAVAQTLTYLKDKQFGDYFEVSSAATTWTAIEKEEYKKGTIPADTIQYDAAKMMKRIADKIGVKYNYRGTGGTFATPKMAQKYLEDELGYSIDRQIGGKKAKRLKNIVNSLNANKPVIMAALGGCEDGHAWVVDGYMKNEDSAKAKNDYFIHCNFGWGGSNDGWYLIDVLHSEKNDDSLLDPKVSEQDMKYNWMFRYLFF